VTRYCEIHEKINKFWSKLLEKTFNHVGKIRGRSIQRRWGGWIALGV